MFLFKKCLPAIYDTYQIHQFDSLPPPLNHSKNLTQKTQPKKETTTRFFLGLPSYTNKELMDSSSSFRALALRASYSLDPGAPGSGSPVGLNTAGVELAMLFLLGVGWFQNEDVLLVGIWSKNIWCFRF